MFFLCFLFILLHKLRCLLEGVNLLFTIFSNCFSQFVSFGDRLLDFACHPEFGFRCDLLFAYVLIGRADHSPQKLLFQLGDARLVVVLEIVSTFPNLRTQVST